MLQRWTKLPAVTYAVKQAGARRRGQISKYEQLSANKLSLKLTQDRDVDRFLKKMRHVKSQDHLQRCLATDIKPFRIQHGTPQIAYFRHGALNSAQCRYQRDTSTYIFSHCAVIVFFPTVHIHVSSQSTSGLFTNTTTYPECDPGHFLNLTSSFPALMTYLSPVPQI